MGQSSETQIRVQAVRDLIRAGKTNDEIREALPQYELALEMLRAHRRKIGIPNPIPPPTVHKCVVMRPRLARRCPKCGGYTDGSRCLNCGLTNETGIYRDFVYNKVVNLY